MTTRSNIICFTGRDTYAIRSETDRFIQAFRDRHDANSIDIYQIEEVRDWRKIGQDMQTTGLFVEKRLFVFRGSLRKE
jgi:DNA polymerase III delta subunit